MKTILVPVNFSDCANNAARYAADLAMIIKADLHLVHVVQIPMASIEMVMTEYIYEEMLEAANTSLKKLLADLRKHTQGKVHIETILEGGSITSKIKDRCSTLKPYAVILGASGASLEKFLEGSPVASLLHNLDFPVLVVPENVHFRRYHRVLLACDLDDISKGLPHSLPFLKDLREYFGCRFDAITVETTKVLAGEQAVFTSGAWKELLKDIYPDVHFIKTNKIEKGILEYLEHQEADLILVFPKKHRFFEFHVSQSRKLAKHSPIPVLSLHE